jgi:hypothetical protein
VARRLEPALAKEADEVVPYKLLPDAVESVKQVVYSRLRLFICVMMFAYRQKSTFESQERMALEWPRWTAASHPLMYCYDVPAHLLLLLRRPSTSASLNRSLNNLKAL